jgi:hypothetical protein
MGTLSAAKRRPPLGPWPWPYGDQPMDSRSRKRSSDHHSTSPPGHIPQYTHQHPRPYYRQRSSTFINTHQRPSTPINVHQHPSMFINTHQRSSTPGQHIHDAPKYSPFRSLHALMADTFYYGGKTSRPQTTKTGGLGIRHSITKVES